MRCLLGHGTLRSAGVCGVCGVCSVCMQAQTRYQASLTLDAKGLHGCIFGD